MQVLFEIQPLLRNVLRWRLCTIQQLALGSGLSTYERLKYMYKPLRPIEDTKNEGAV